MTFVVIEYNSVECNMPKTFPESGELQIIELQDKCHFCKDRKRLFTKSFRIRLYLIRTFTHISAPENPKKPIAQ